MYTKHILIQKIEEDGSANFYQITADNIQWTFEYRRTKIANDPDFFPFLLFGEHPTPFPKRPGAETKIFVKENEVTFCDDYGVPAGFVIAILFPENFIPDILKFKDKPIIPVRLQGQLVASAPGQFQIFYNRLEKRSAIVFSIHENIFFGFKCVSKKISDEEFPKNESITSDEFFDVTISTELLKIEAITNEDLKIINETLSKTDLEEVNNTINEILTALQTGNKNDAKTSLNKFSKLILDGASLIGNLTKIIDSYHDGGAPQQFVAKLLSFVNL
jgi:hypothetical protein